MKKSFSWPIVAIVFGLLPHLSPICRGEAGNNNPTGVSGEYNGSITTGGSYDPYTGNVKRFIDDLTVTGAIGAYPLKWTRILNTRDFGWSNSYRWALWLRIPDYSDPEYDPDTPDGMLTYPDGRQLTFYYDAGAYYPLGGGEAPDRLVAAGTGLYELIMNDGGRVQFQRVGTAASSTYRAIKIFDPYKQITVLTYDSATGLLTRVTEPGGRYLQINRPSPTAAVSTVQAFDGRGNLLETVTYTYTTLTFTNVYGNSPVTGSYLTQVNYDDGGVATYTYQSSNVGGTITWGLIKTCNDVRYAGPMKKIEYEFLRESNQYGPAVGQILKEKNATTHETVSEIIYPPDYPGPSPYPAPPDMSRLKRTEKRGDGATRTFQYGLGAELESYTDFKGQTSYIEFSASANPGNRIKSFRDARGNVTRMEKRVSDGAVMVVTNPDGTTVQFTYNGAGTPFVTSRKDENGFYTYHDRDGSNRIWRTRYPDGSSEQFTYNGFGQILTHTMTSGGTEVFEYDTRGLKTTYTPPATESDLTPGQHPTRYYYFTSGPHTDRLQRVQDPRGCSTSYEYNLRGQVTKVTHQDGNYTQSGYNPDGTLAWTADENHPGASTDANQRTRYTYDEYKRVLTVTNAMGETTTNSYGLDPMWADPYQKKPLLHTTNCMKFTLSPMNKNVVYEYDANFRKTYQGVALGTPDAAATTFEYDAVGNLIKTTDPRGYITTFGYDNRNRKIWMNDPITADRNSSGHTLNWEYDGVGNKRKETRADNAFRSWEYQDGMNRLTKAIDWGTGGAAPATTYSQTSNGRTRYITDAKGAVYTFQYDEQLRKTSETYPPAYGNASSNDHFWYDEVGNLRQYRNPAGQIKYLNYDNRNRVWDKWWSNAAGPLVSTRYDAASRVTSITTNNGETVVAFGYDNANRKIWEDQTQAGYATRRVATPRDADGNRTSLAAPNYYISYTYTARNQLASIANYTNFTYDSNGNLTQRRGLWPYVNDTNSAYDALNRVTQTEYGDASVIFARSHYQYDSVGREVATWRDEQASQGESFAYNPTGQLTQVNYDASNVWTGAPSVPRGGVGTYSYTVDTLNRASESRTLDQTGANPTVKSYTANGMNQYESINSQAIVMTPTSTSGFLTTAPLPTMPITG